MPLRSNSCAIGYSGVGNFIRTLSARLTYPKMTDRV